MIRTLAITLAIATALATSAPMVFASSSDKLTSEISARITEKLTSQGYEVRKIKSEDGLFEAYVIKDGVRQELYLNSELDIVNRKSDD
jgi:peptidase YpeB-like protein